MTRAPYVLSKARRPFARDMQLFDTSLGWRFVNPKMKAKYGTDSMGQTAENVAEQFGVSRDDQDAFALRSQQKAAAARASGRLALEIVAGGDPAAQGRPGVGGARRVHPPRHDAGRARQAASPAFRTDGKGSVTAGNSSGLNDGAAALLVASEPGCQGVRARAAGPRASRRPRRVSSRASWGWGRCRPRVAPSQLAGLTLDQMDVIELNEAFAAQSLACLRELGIRRRRPPREPQRRRDRARAPAGHVRRPARCSPPRGNSSGPASATRCAPCASAWGRAWRWCSSARDLRVRGVRAGHP